tara:strand:+ start:123 stop:524 length:402 start_codon:yes stop_codon:yes gene_type:complete
LPQNQKQAPPDHFKNPKTIIQGKLRNAREHYNSVEKTAGREDRILDKTDETTVRIKAMPDYFKNPKTIIQGNLRYARERYNSVGKTAGKEDRISDKTDERTARTEDRILEKTGAGSGVAEVGEKEEQKEGLGL